METTTELQQMVDVSIGVESNILDLNVLNSLLHIIVRRLCPCFENESTVDPDLKGNYIYIYKGFFTMIII